MMCKVKKPKRKKKYTTKIVQRGRVYGQCSFYSNTKHAFFTLTTMAKTTRKQMRRRKKHNSRKKLNDLSDQLKLD